MVPETKVSSRGRYHPPETNDMGTPMWAEHIRPYDFLIRFILAFPVEIQDFIGGSTNKIGEK